MVQQREEQNKVQLSEHKKAMHIKMDNKMKRRKKQFKEENTREQKIYITSGRMKVPHFSVAAEAAQLALTNG